MFRNLANLTLCLALLGSALSSQAQRAPRVPRTGVSTAAAVDSTCVFSFSSGTGNSFIQYCVSTTGNITQIQTPEGHELFVQDVGTDG